MCTRIITAVRGWMVALFSRVNTGMSDDFVAIHMDTPVECFFCGNERIDVYVFDRCPSSLFGGVIFRKYICVDCNTGRYPTRKK